jgi:crotonobetainyl-CoA:carnitine CoA-transferase CaiB-like acyl-CoA transferase
MSAILDGIRVLDFGRYMAGPWCAALLEVIRIERTGGGEDRLHQYPINDDGVAASFLALNRNKLGITLDLAHAQAGEILAPLVRSADIVVANLPAEVLRRMRIDEDALRALRPDIVIAAISAYGDAGPLADRVGLDGIAQAMSGAAFLSGQPDAPSKCFAPWADILAGTLAAFGAVAALRHRDRCGIGQRVGADLFTTGIAALSWMHTEQAATGIDRRADGNRTQSSAPGDLFRTRDGWVLMQTIGPALFARWAQLVGEPEWIHDPRFADDISRSNQRELLCRRTQQWIAELDTQEALDRLGAARIPCGPVLSPQQVLDHPQTLAAGLFQPVDYPGLAQPAQIMRHPLRFSASPTELRYPPPTLGQHTDEVLAGLGFAPSAIADFRQRGLI